MRAGGLARGQSNPLRAYTSASLGQGGTVVLASVQIVRGQLPGAMMFQREFWIMVVPGIKSGRCTTLIQNRQLEDGASSATFLPSLSTG